MKWNRDTVNQMMEQIVEKEQKEQGAQTDVVGSQKDVFDAFVDALQSFAKAFNDCVEKVANKISEAMHPDVESVESNRKAQLVTKSFEMLNYKHGMYSRTPRDDPC